MPLQDGEKSSTICAFVYIQHQSVGQTDRFAIAVSRSACIHMLTRDKDGKNRYTKLTFCKSLTYG